MFSTAVCYSCPLIVCSCFWSSSYLISVVIIEIRFFLNDFPQANFFGNQLQLTEQILQKLSFLLREVTKYTKMIGTIKNTFKNITRIKKKYSCLNYVMMLFICISYFIFFNQYSSNYITFSIM